MRIPVVAALLLTFCGFVPTAQLPSPADWAKADVETRRLDPSAFPDLPDPVRAELLRRGCTIPQVYADGRPHNIVRGAFRNAGQTDVAVLCSRGRSSAILVMQDGDPGNVSEIAPKQDADFLQLIGPGKVGFSREISLASPEYIREQHRRHGGPAPPQQLTHAGIDDAFIEKASVVWYWHQGKWLQLTGTD
jgi:hypothetical protein